MAASSLQLVISVSRQHAVVYAERDIDRGFLSVGLFVQCRCVEMVVNVVKRFQPGGMDFVVVFLPQPALQNSDAKILNGVLNEGKYEFFDRNRRTPQKRYDIG